MSRTNVKGVVDFKVKKKNKCQFLLVLVLHFYNVYC